MIKKFLQKIFKKISYAIFLKIYGKIEKSIDCSQDKRIKVEIVNIEKDLSYRVYNISDGRLYTDRIHDTAILLDNKIIEEPSFQLRYKGHLIHNSKIKDNIVFKRGTPRKLRNLNGTVLSLLTGGAGNENYSHWLSDVLPRIALCNKTVNLSEIDYFLLPDHVKQFQSETLDCLKIPKHKRLSSKKFRHIKAKKLIVTDHPVVTSVRNIKDTHNIPAWIIHWLKDVFLNKSTATNKKNKIYIDRNEANGNFRSSRSISNEDEIKKYLLKNNFIFARLHEMKFNEEVDLFHNAECVVGLHGAGLVNIVFCRPGTRVIELINTSTKSHFEVIAKKNNLNYTSITVEAKQNVPNQQGQIEIPVSSLKKIIEK